MITVCVRSGSYCPAGSTSNSLCPIGSYCVNPSTIAACPGGTYGTMAGATSQSQGCATATCPPNTITASNGSCICAAGFRSALLCFSFSVCFSGPIGGPCLCACALTSSSCNTLYGTCASAQQSCTCWSNCVGVSSGAATCQSGAICRVLCLIFDSAYSQVTSNPCGTGLTNVECKYSAFIPGPSYASCNAGYFGANCNGTYDIVRDCNRLICIVSACPSCGSFGTCNSGINSNGNHVSGSAFTVLARRRLQLHKRPRWQRLPIQQCGHMQRV